MTNDVVELLREIIENYGDILLPPYSSALDAAIKLLSSSHEPISAPTVDYVQFGWVPFHDTQGVDPGNFVEHEENCHDIITGWRWVPAYAAVQGPAVKSAELRPALLYKCDKCGTPMKCGPTQWEYQCKCSAERSADV